VRLTASLRVDGHPMSLRGLGNGPVDALAAALQSAFDAELQVLDYHEHAIGRGAAARAAAYIEMRVGERRLHGVGIDADIVAASFKALLSGMARARALQPAVADSPLAD
jgi:2-isopropylmalate synthase